MHVEQRCRDREVWMTSWDAASVYAGALTAWGGSFRVFTTTGERRAERRRASLERCACRVIH